MDEPISEIQELNDLREKVLRKEEISPDEYHRVLVAVRKLRRDRKEAPAEKAPAMTNAEIGALIFGPSKS